MRKQKRVVALMLSALMLTGTITLEPMKASAEEQSNITQVEEDGEEQVSQGIDTSKEDTVSEEEPEESNKDLSDEQEQNDNISDDDSEDIEELKANSWRG